MSAPSTRSSVTSADEAVTMLLTLVRIGARAADAHDAAKVRREAEAEWRAALTDWKAAHGIRDRIKADDPLALCMFEEVGASPAGVALRCAQRDEKNARARLERVIRNVPLATAQALVHGLTGRKPEVVA
ncbi:MAG: hypothetical protein QM581_06320 [Pseudomonas sp.]